MCPKGSIGRCVPPIKQHPGEVGRQTAEPSGRHCKLLRCGRKARKHVLNSIPCDRRANSPIRTSIEPCSVALNEIPTAQVTNLLIYHRQDPIRLLKPVAPYALPRLQASSAVTDQQLATPLDDRLKSQVVIDAAVRQDYSIGARRFPLSRRSNRPISPCHV